MPTTLPFTSPLLLAPMEGVTEACFRDLVLERNAPDALGGAFTEFIRVHRQPLRKGALAEHLGPRRFPQPVGLQLMGNETAPLEFYTDAAIVAGAPLVDLNFGCPAKRVFQGCAGSALLEFPERIELYVRTCVRAAAGRVPVTAKIRSGIRDDARLEELARAAEAGGAAMLTVHCRTREEGYRDCADWRRVARAVAAVRIPVCGNGSVLSRADGARMQAETGCAYVMIGRAALGDPWVFSGRAVDAREAARFLLAYARELLERRYRAPHGAMGRVKQLISYWTAGGLIPGGTDEAREEERTRLLRVQRPAELWGWLAEAAGVAPPFGGADGPAESGVDARPSEPAAPEVSRAGK